MPNISEIFVQIVLIALMLLTFAPLFYASPKFRSNYHKPQWKWIVDGLVWLMIKTTVAVGFLIANAGLIYTSLTIQGLVNEEWKTKFNDIGTGLTIYAAALAVILSVARREHSLKFFDETTGITVPVDAERMLRRVQDELRELRRVQSRDNIIIVLALSLVIVMLMIMLVSRH